MRAVAIITGAIALLVAVAFVLHGGDGAAAAVGHSCGATDKRFIQTATTNMTALELLAEGLRSGEIAPDEVARHARDSAKRVRHVKPRDPSLRTAQRFMEGMFSEYGQAVSLAARKQARAGAHMHRAHGLANSARQVLLAAQPELAEHGCEIAPLL